MNNCYLGVSGSGKTYQLRHIVLDALSWGRKVYVVGRPEEWSMFNNIELFDAHNLSQYDITTLLNARNCVIVIDSIELIDNRTFIGALAVKSRVRNIDLYVSAFGIVMLDIRFLENINHLYIGYLNNGKQTIKGLSYTFNIHITDYVDNICSHKFIKVL